MSRSSGRGQVEPLAALAAVAALALGLALYAGALDGAVPRTERTVEDATLRKTVATLRTGAVVVPERVDAAAETPLEGYRLHVTVAVANGTWTAGADPPPDAAVAARTLPVRVSPGTAVPGRVRVEVWPWPAG